MSVRHTEVTTDPAILGDDEQIACDIREVLDRIGDKWSVLVIVELANGTRRFRRLQRAIAGISQSLLTKGFGVGRESGERRGVVIVGLLTRERERAPGS